ncbi:O-acyltransferase WSD1-like, partial [Dendrobium catenatum]|uniref:O-acyltransferase WSD1-like n=1 Tax=Dendrobium catenatum TaxID=906689 RepID=UPI0010A02A37
KVNLDEHIVLADPDPKAVAAASDPTVGDLYVENYTAGLCSSQLDYSRPPWEVHILAIRTSEAACIAVLHLNHSIGDATSLLSLLHACTRRTSDPESLPSLPKIRRPPTIVAASFGPFIFLCWIWNFLIYVWNTLVEVILFVSTTIYLKDSKILNMGKEGIKYRSRRIVHCTLCLDDIIDIKNTIGCTINDVLVGATSAALSRYLSRKYGGLLPKQLLIRTTVVINIRRISGINVRGAQIILFYFNCFIEIVIIVILYIMANCEQDLAYMMKQGSEAKWGNRIGYFLLRLPVMKCEDPLDYARNVAANTEKKKKSWAATLSYKSAVMIYKCLGTKVRWILFIFTEAHNFFLKFWLNM